VPRGKRQQGDVPGLLDGASQTALVRGANASEPPGYDLAALGHKALQKAHIAVGIASIFSVQNLQTFLRRKNLPRPPGPPEGRPPGRPPERGPEPEPEPEPGPEPELGPELETGLDSAPEAAWEVAGALVSGAFA